MRNSVVESASKDMELTRHYQVNAGLRQRQIGGINGYGRGGRVHVDQIEEVEEENEPRRVLLMVPVIKWIAFMNK